MKRQFLVAGMLAAIGPLAGIGVAAQSSNPANLSSSDRTFARDAAQGGIAEVKMGELAEQDGQSQQVKDFGRRMVEDHSNANGELTLDAAKEHIQLPTQMNSKDQATYDRVARLSGAAFDRAYSRDMVSDHEKDISDFQKEAKDGRNDTIKDFAANTAPILQEHLRMARQIESTVSQTSSRINTKNNNPS